MKYVNTIYVLSQDIYIATMIINEQTKLTWQRLKLNIECFWNDLSYFSSRRERIFIESRMMSIVSDLQRGILSLKVAWWALYQTCNEEHYPQWRSSTYNGGQSECFYFIVYKLFLLKDNINSGGYPSIESIIQLYCRNNNHTCSLNTSSALLLKNETW